MWHRLGLLTGIVWMNATPVAGQMPERSGLARELAIAMKVVTTVQQSMMASSRISTSMDSAVQRRIAAGTRNFVEKYVTPDSVLVYVVPVYAERFTEGELRQLIEFARSPAGARYLLEGPELGMIVIRVSQAIIAQREGEELPAHLASTTEGQTANDKLARELLTAVSGARGQAAGTSTGRVDHAGEPALNEKSAAMKNLMRLNSSRDAVDAALVREYSRRHSAEELLQLVNFFQSPLGVRLVLTQMEAEERVGVFIGDVIQQHRPEFSKILSDALPQVPPA